MYHRTYLQPLEAVGGQPRVFDRVLEAGHHILNVAHPTRGVAVDVLVDAAKVNLGRLKNPQTCKARPRGRSQVCVSQNFCVLGIELTDLRELQLKIFILIHKTWQLPFGRVQPSHSGFPS